MLPSNRSFIFPHANWILQFFSSAKTTVCPHSQLITLFKREFKHIPLCLPRQSSG